MSYTQGMGAYHGVYPGQVIVEAAAGLGGYARGATIIPPGIHPSAIPPGIRPGWQPPDPGMRSSLGEYYSPEYAWPSGCAVAGVGAAPGYPGYPWPGGCSMAGVGASPGYPGYPWPGGCPMAAFGAAEGFAKTFTPSAIWTDIQKAGECYNPSGVYYEVCQNSPGASVCGACNYAGKRAASTIAKGLNQLGYGILPEDGSGITQVATAFKSFLSDHHLTPGPGFGFTQDGLALMKQKLDAGETPGPGDTIIYDDKGLPTDKGTSRAGLGTMLLAGLVIAGGVALLAVAAKKKSGTSTQHTSATYKYAANW
jgi:hypothetical protein